MSDTNFPVKITNMSINTQKISHRQEKVLLALLENPSISAASRNSGVNRGTIYKYLNDEKFAREYRKRRSEMFTATTGLLVKASAIAVQSLVSMILDAKTADTAKVSACRAVLQYTASSQDLDVLSHDASLLAAELERSKL